MHSVRIESDTNEKRELSVREHAYEPNMCKMSGMVNRNTFTDALIFIGTAGAMLQYRCLGDDNKWKLTKAIEGKRSFFFAFFYTTRPLSMRANKLRLTRVCASGPIQSEEVFISLHSSCLPKQFVVSYAIMFSVRRKAQTRALSRV